MERSFEVHRGRPSPPECWFGYSPAARRSSGRYGVTQRLWVAKPARRPTLVSGPASNEGVGPGTSFHPTGSPAPFRTAGLVTSQTRLLAGSVIRCASDSRSRSRRLDSKAPPHGLAGPAADGTTSAS